MLRRVGARFAPVILSGILTVSAASPALACACGCAVFDVGTSSLLPTGPGGTVFLEYDFLNQTKNWSGDSGAPKANNDDKNIRSNFFVAGGQYMFNDSWGVMAEVPYTQRHFATEDGGTLGTFNHGALGDIKLMGVYSGFSPDMSTGVIFGVKLPTGDHAFSGFDPDTEIGSGSTDLLLGGYHSGQLGATGDFVWYAQALWQRRLATQDGYRPGSEFNTAVGVSYNNWSIGKDVGIAPVLQVIYSHRGRDGGPAGEPDDTGYDRALIAPGVAFSTSANWKLYADVEVPVAQHMNGNQLIAPVAFKVIVSHAF
ncbi:MAG TPA: hypothetical protein VG867_09530 [Rhizomicrobium sp.]|nr:hypothetical protein [Rhizomicrobium sp.]